MFPVISVEQMIPIGLSVVCVIGLVLSDGADFRPGRYLFKPLAAVAFIALALSLDATGSGFGRWMLAGLLCCLVGDICLMMASDRFFLAGLVVFLCGHLLYCVAFLQLHPDPAILIVSVPLVFAFIFPILRWLTPHLPADMKLSVWLYIAVIAAMLVCASMTAEHARGFLIICGAVGFAISDLAVAKRQFVSPGKTAALWGTSLYFFSQMLLALSVGLG